MVGAMTQYHLQESAINVQLPQSNGVGEPEDTEWHYLYP